MENFDITNPLRLTPSPEDDLELLKKLADPYPHLKLPNSLIPDSLRMLLIPPDALRTEDALTESYLAFLKKYPWIEGRIPFMYKDDKGLITVGVGMQLFGPEDATNLPFVIKNANFIEFRSAPNFPSLYPSIFWEQSSINFPSSRQVGQGVFDIGGILAQPYPAGFSAYNTPFGRALKEDILKAYNWVRKHPHTFVKKGKKGIYGYMAYKNPLNNVFLDEGTMDETARKKIKEHIQRLESVVIDLYVLPRNIQIGLLDITYNVGSIRPFEGLLEQVGKRDWCAAAAKAHRKTVDKNGLIKGAFPRNAIVAILFCQQGEREFQSNAFFTSLKEAIAPLTFDGCLKKLQKYSWKSMHEELMAIDMLFDRGFNIKPPLKK